MLRDSSVQFHGIFKPCACRGEQQIARAASTGPFSLREEGWDEGFYNLFPLTPTRVKEALFTTEAPNKTLKKISTAKAKSVFLGICMHFFACLP